MEKGALHHSLSRYFGFDCDTANTANTANTAIIANTDSTANTANTDKTANTVRRFGVNTVHLYCFPSVSSCHLSTLSGFCIYDQIIEEE